MAKKSHYIAFVLYLCCSLAIAQTELQGIWEGAIRLPTASLKIIAEIAHTPDGWKGKMDIPQQGAASLPLKNILAQLPQISFTLVAAPSPEAQFEGVLTGDTLAGKFTQSGYTTSFYLVRQSPSTEVLPYRQEALSFTNGENILKGTLSLPPGRGKHPAIVLISGSGPQNRDGDFYGFKTFKILADHLTRRGIAVLRYDDRNVGESVGKALANSSSAEFADDVRAAVCHLRSRADIDSAQVGLLGHSEGGLIAPMVAATDPRIAFTILMAAPSVSGKEILAEQTRLILKASGANEEQIAYTTQLNHRFYEAVVEAYDDTSTWAALRREMMEMMPANMPQTDKQQVADNQINTIRTPWFRFFIPYQPKVALEQLKCPTLVLFGELDMQVSAQQNEKPLLQALRIAKNKDVSSKVFPRANHLFQAALTGMPSEYATLDKQFVAGFVEYIGDWLVQRVKIVK